MSRDNDAISRRVLVTGFAGTAVLGINAAVFAADDAPKDERKMKAEFSNIEDRNKALLDLQKERKEFAYVPRLVAIRITNSSTLYAIKSVLVEAIDENPMIPEGFQRNTGLIPAAFELNPGESKTTLLPATTKVQPTSARCHIISRYILNGFEESFSVTAIKVANPAENFLGVINCGITDPIFDFKRDGKEPPPPKSTHDFKR
jgi:hypothetical protein